MKIYLLCDALENDYGQIHGYDPNSAHVSLEVAKTIAESEARECNKDARNWHCEWRDDENGTLTLYVDWEIFATNPLHYPLGWVHVDPRPSVSIVEMELDERIAVHP